jgi:hypothetical protein
MKYNPADNRELAELTKAVRSIAKEGGVFLRTERKNFKREGRREKQSATFRTSIRNRNADWLSNCRHCFPKQAS